MAKPRLDYAYIATRIDPAHPQNLGTFAISRWKDGYPLHVYHYSSLGSERLTNRSAEAMPVIGKSSRIWRECMNAIERLRQEELRTENEDR